MSINVNKKLNEKINPGYVKTRQGTGGQKLSYVAGFQMEMIANEIFDYEWSRETVYMNELYKRDYVKEYGKDKKNMVEVAYVCKVRVFVDIDGATIIKEGTGFGNGQAGENNISSAYELAIKEAETDAMKRALKSFGSAFGLELWDKDANISKSYENGKNYDVEYIETMRNMESCTEYEDVAKIYKNYKGNYKNELAKISIKMKGKLNNG